MDITWCFTVDLSGLKAFVTFIETYTKFFTPVASFVGAALIMIQIRSTTRLNRKNLTFEKIKELEELLYDNKNSELKTVINQVGLLEEGDGPLNQEDAVDLLRQKKYLLYQLLNYFESLSLAVFEKNIDKKILFRIYGKRLRRAYVKLHPFIILIAGESSDPRYKPYQHFDKLYDKLKRYFGRHK